MGSREAQRRIISTVQRVESDPRTYTPPRRTPRLSGDGDSHYWCQLTGTIAAATGTWPALTAGTLASQTVYSSASGSLVALSGTNTIRNWWPTSFVAGKTTLLISNGDGTFDLAEQAC